MTIVIYDSTGYVISQMSGDVREPVGVPFLWTEVPEGKFLIGVDTSVTPNVPVFERLPVSEIEQIKADLLYVAMMGGVDL